MTLLRYAIQHLAAPNDVNGNPRRLYLVHDLIRGGSPRAYDEGYLGSEAVPQGIREDAHELAPRLEVTPKAYRDTLRRFGVPT